MSCFRLQVLKVLLLCVKEKNISLILYSIKYHNIKIKQNWNKVKAGKEKKKWLISIQVSLDFARKLKISLVYHIMELDIHV